MLIAERTLHVLCGSPEKRLGNQQKETNIFFLSFFVMSVMLKKKKKRMLIAERTLHVLCGSPEKRLGNQQKETNVWLLGFEPRSPRPQRGILTTKLQPHCCQQFRSLIFLHIYVFHMNGEELFLEHIFRTNAYLKQRKLFFS